MSDTTIYSQGRVVGFQDDNLFDSRAAYPKAHASGLTKQEVFCLHLMIPESGNPALDRLIKMKRSEGHPDNPTASIKTTDRENAIRNAYNNHPSPAIGDRFRYNNLLLTYTNEGWVITDTE